MSPSPVVDINDISIMKMCRAAARNKKIQMKRLQSERACDRRTAPPRSSNVKPHRIARAAARTCFAKGIVLTDTDMPAIVSKSRSAPGIGWSKKPSVSPRMCCMNEKYEPDIDYDQLPFLLAEDNPDTLIDEIPCDIGEVVQQAIINPEAFDQRDEDTDDGKEHEQVSSEMAGRLHEQIIEERPRAGLVDVETVALKADMRGNVRKQIKRPPQASRKFALQLEKKRKTTFGIRQDEHLRMKHARAKTALQDTKRSSEAVKPESRVNSPRHPLEAGRQAQECDDAVVFAEVEALKVQAETMRAEAEALKIHAEELVSAAQERAQELERRVRSEADIVKRRAEIEARVLKARAQQEIQEVQARRKAEEEREEEDRRQAEAEATARCKARKKAEEKRGKEDRRRSAATADARIREAKAIRRCAVEEAAALKDEALREVTDLKAKTEAEVLARLQGEASAMKAAMEAHAREIHERAEEDARLLRKQLESERLQANNVLQEKAAQVLDPMIDAAWEILSEGGSVVHVQLADALADVFYEEDDWNVLS